MWPHWCWLATAIPALTVAIVNWALWVVKSLSQLSWYLPQFQPIWTWFLPVQSLSNIKDCLCLHPLPIFPSHLFPFCCSLTWRSHDSRIAWHNLKSHPVQTQMQPHLSPCSIYLAVLHLPSWPWLSPCSCCCQEVPAWRLDFTLHHGSGAAQRNPGTPKDPLHYASGQGWASDYDSEVDFLQHQSHSMLKSPFAP